MSPARLILAALAIALPSLAAAQTDSQLKLPAYWQARFAQVRQNLAEARARENLEQTRLEHMLVKNKGKPDLIAVDRGLYKQQIDKARQRRAAAEDALRELNKAADELDVPRDWRGGGEPLIIKPAAPGKPPVPGAGRTPPATTD